MTRIRLCVALAAVALAGCASDEGGSASPDQQEAPIAGSSTTPTQVLGPVGMAPVGDRSREVLWGEQVKVDMTSALRYVPARVSIRAGDTIVWSNMSSTVHTVTADPALAKDPSHVRLPKGAQTFNSGNIPPGATFRHTFDVPGEYMYFCIPHETSGMVGRINVWEK